MAEVSAELLDVLERIERLHPVWVEEIYYGIHRLHFTNHDGIRINITWYSTEGEHFFLITIDQAYDDGSEPVRIYCGGFSDYDPRRPSDYSHLLQYTNRVYDAKRDKNKEQEAREKFFGK